jgi:hypothetical protein
MIAWNPCSPSRSPRSLRLSLLALTLGSASVLLAPSACTPGDCGEEDSCGEGGEPSSGGQRSSGGAASSGGKRSGGATGSGGLGGDKGSGASSGQAGDKGETGGAPMVDLSPRVTETMIDGRKAEPGERVLGVREGASIRISFSAPMDTASVEEALIGKDEKSAPSSFVIGWNEDNTELTLILKSSVKYDEVDSLDAPRRELGLLITRAAKDAEGRALADEFILDFTLLRRYRVFIEPDLENSAIAYGNVPFDIVAPEYLQSIDPWMESHCPWLNPENTYDAAWKETFRSEFPYTIVRNFASHPGRHSSNPKGTRASIYAFPLSGVPEDLERATLKLAKWERVVVDTKDTNNNGSTTDFVPHYSSTIEVYDMLFSVDALPSFALPKSVTGPEAQAVFGTPSRRANLLNSEGEEYSKGYGFFSFDVTDVVEVGLSRGEPWSMYRAEFDGMPVVKDDPLTVCVTLALEVSALIE